MPRRYKPFLIWLVMWSALAVLGNLPRTVGSPRMWPRKAGVPCLFIAWKDGEVAWFDPVALATNVAVWSGLAFGSGGLVVLSAAWSRRPARPPTITRLQSISFWISLAILSAVALVLNGPPSRGPPENWTGESGYPWTFAGWKEGKLVSFDLVGLAGNAAVWVSLAVVTAWVLARIRKAIEPAAARPGQTPPAVGGDDRNEDQGAGGPFTPPDR